MCETKGMFCCGRKYVKWLQLTLSASLVADAISKVVVTTVTTYAPAVVVAAKKVHNTFSLSFVNSDLQKVIVLLINGLFLRPLHNKKIIFKNFCSSSYHLQFSSHPWYMQLLLLQL